jgi:hypothetical protein
MENINITPDWEYVWVLGDKWDFAKVRKSGPKTYDAIIGEFYWRDIHIDRIKFPKDEREINMFKLNFREYDE